jgi:hypothetical protein
MLSASQGQSGPASSPFAHGPLLSAVTPAEGSSEDSGRSSASRSSISLRKGLLHQSLQQQQLQQAPGSTGSSSSGAAPLPSQLAAIMADDNAQQRVAAGPLTAAVMAPSHTQLSIISENQTVRLPAGSLPSC